jgi:uncharacterized DUF497 family protein
MKLKIQFDTKKSKTNFAKHGFLLSACEDISWDSAVISKDTRKNYGEDRYVATAMRDDQMVTFVFTPRKGEIRIISLRKANKKEERMYVADRQAQR